jgi:7-carboxy-7-deazaguanine synthase
VKEEGFIYELFLSFQGEGLYVGRFQLFVRLADTTVENPVAARDLADFIGGLLDRATGLHSISVTGGEPLEQPGFLASFLPRCRSLGVPLYLETNGLHPGAARSVFPLVDIISLDITLPSLCGGGDLISVYEEVLPLAARADTFCKIVVAEGMDRDEFGRAVEVIERHDRGMPLVIQPATPVDGCATVAPDLLGALYSEAAGRLADVRIIPQCHPIVGIR